MIPEKEEKLWNDLLNLVAIPQKVYSAEDVIKIAKAYHEIKLEEHINKDYSIYSGARATVCKQKDYWRTWVNYDRCLKSCEYHKNNLDE
jgi:hypothetical protein